MHQLRFPKCATSRLPTIDERRCRFPPMRRILAIVGSAIFLVIAPGIVVGYIPWRICRWHVEAPLAGIFSFRILGVLLIAVGLPVLLDSFARFAVQGLGTPAPIFPTRHLVVSGLYRYVRNPMYVAVVTLILGQGLFFGDARVLEYGIAVWTAFHLFVLIYEEPTLRNTYGSESKRSAQMSTDGFRVCALGTESGRQLTLRRRIAPDHG
jgi:protein-S-isoprenylcysteine O-methyltransferase Ste14